MKNAAGSARLPNTCGYGPASHKVVKDSSSISFDDAPPEDAESPKLKESVVIKVDCLADGGSASGGLGGAVGLPSMANRENVVPAISNLPSCGTVFPGTPQQHGLPPRGRADFPAWGLGFFWAKNRPDLRWVRANWKDMLTWEPLQKVYLYRDEESAAEDMAFILFQIWHFPVNTPLYVKAAAFHTKHRFEHGKRID